MKKIIFSTAVFLTMVSGISAQIAIQCKDMMVIYAGIPSSFKAGASGEYTDVVATPSMVLASQSQIGQYISICATGKDKKGASVALGCNQYLVKKAPKPELFWAGIEEGGQANTSSGSLGCRYGNNVPFDPSLAQFQILSYTITIEGIKGSLEGSGSSISSAHLAALKSVSPGNIAIISVRVSGPYEGLVTSSFKI
jgi:hypothetical protein